MNTNIAAPSTLFLGQTGEFWDLCVLISLGFAVIVAVAVAISTAGSVSAHKREARAAQLALEAYQTETAGKVADATKAGIAAGETAGNANNAAAQANARAADANARAAEANLALAQFKAPRVISAEAREQMVPKLRPFAGSPFNFSVQVDQESVDLMEQIASVLAAAGWERRATAANVTYMPPGGLPHAGVSAGRGVQIQISSTRNNDWAPAVIALRDALRGAGIETEGKSITDGTESPDAIHVYVGGKP